MPTLFAVFGRPDGLLSQTTGIGVGLTIKWALQTGYDPVTNHIQT